MPRCAFLVEADLVPDDALVIPHLEARGWEVTSVPWREPGVDWGGFDLVVIRSAWDYHLAHEAFLEVVTEVDGRTRLENSLGLVRWNASKTYLADLEAGGIPIVPTAYGEGGALPALDERFDQAEFLVLKPVVGASAYGTRRVARDVLDWPRLTAAFHEHPFMVQPLVPTVLTEGEYSLFYFDGTFSHAVRKAPAPGDFRVQEEHGGTTRSWSADGDLLKAAEAVLERLDETPLYARVDLVRTPDGGEYWLMELELVEPVLYFGTQPDAPRRFTEAVVGRFIKR